LLAHELTHVVQQGGSGAGAQLQRACLPAADCAAKRATLEQFVADTKAKPENVSKEAKRAAACGKVPPDPACTSDGHGAKAPALTAILKANYPSRLGFITGIFVNKDNPADWGAVTQSCASFTPPIPGGGRCTFVPDMLEAEAKMYQTGKAPGGKTRADWLTDTVGTLTHETEHARFNAQPDMAKPNAASCDFATHKRNLSEMSAHLSEMHIYYRAALAKPEKNRFDAFDAKFKFWVDNGSEDIKGIVKDINCKCECADANNYITKTVEGVVTSQKWDTFEQFKVHSELRDPKWGIVPQWPVAPPAVKPEDLPATAKIPFSIPG
jgi:hypothetical protein